ncbi:MFS transporter [Devosia sp.]|uniref:MFS transporter n=1 Tax=Devosia sp. TaxID=1871048 RepID=UPI003A94CD8D
MTDQEQTPPETGSPVRNIALLSTAQAILGSNQAILMSVAALTGAMMITDKAYATVPVTLMIIGTALATTPAAWSIHTLGRRNGFILGSAIAIPGALLAAYATLTSNFVLFCIGLAMLGTTAAFAQQYRFAAADSVPDAWKPRAIAFVMAGGVVAGFVGPTLSAFSKPLIPEVDFAGTYLVMAGLAVLSIGVLWFTRLAPTVRSAEQRRAGRPLAQLIRTPEIIVPMVTAAVSYALMVLVMVAAPIAMVYVCGHTTEAAAFAIQWHIVSMYAPSFFTGSLISRLGPQLTAGLGLLAIAAAAIVNLTGITVAHFTAALILLGVGWNFGFVASTAMLAKAYRPEEAARVQGLNEQVVFGTMALASILSGVLLEMIGWDSINVMALPFATGAILLLGWSQLRGARQPG